MAVIRLILLVAVLGGLTLLLVQNWSPALSLVFLGMRTLPLPLAMWILFSTATGALTSLVITFLFRLSDYFAIAKRQTPSQATSTSSRTRVNQREKTTPPPANPASSAGRTQYTTNEAIDDWETNNRDDDWNFDEKPEQAPTPSSQSQEFRDSRTSERQPDTKNSSQSDSVYSYNYREPKNTAVGKTESVYDADYRVIIPPYQPPNTNQADDDDWGFFDDDTEDEDKRSRR
ncbi:MAG: LapA family protein [Desmonostoc vinosum HA7617-LM4]|nr:LapA family protein [Desmonostoc vinosum HA7617-LM4]